MKKIIGAIILMGFASYSVAQVTSNFQSNANLQGKCLISAQDINFGTLDFIRDTSPNRIMFSSINVLCNNRVNFSIVPNQADAEGYHFMEGTNGNTDKLKYSLYREAAFGYIKSYWTSSTPITTTANGQMMEFPISLNATRSAGNTLIKPDIYTGTITATVTY